ncbi:MAG: AraC family transcriptional regulator [Shinella sp.]|nr:MAG: AraC family transcriptional regulator [Shinella sp.]
MPVQYGHIDGEPPRPVFLRTEYYRAGTVFPPRRQPWGELNYALEGVSEITIEGVPFLSPPHYAIWIPPGFRHEALNRHDIRYATAYIEAALCADLPDEPCTLALSPLLKAIFADFDARGVRHPQSDADLRLAMVIVDQVRSAPRVLHYLPSTDDPLLAPVLQALQDDPGNKRSAAEWARFAGTTERTLARRAQDLLGMPFNDWRQRLKLVTALSLLEEGHSVQSVSHRLGYGNASAFIAMFRRLTGTSPSQMRSGQKKGPSE